MDEFYKSFGTNLRRLRIEQNLSAGALSRLSGVTISTINNAETHRVLPMLYSAKMLADALGVGLDDMLKGE